MVLTVEQAEPEIPVLGFAPWNLTVALYNSWAVESGGGAWLADVTVTGRCLGGES